jgi:hypothetical protein
MPTHPQEIIESAAVPCGDGEDNTVLLEEEAALLLAHLEAVAARRALQQRVVAEPDALHPGRPRVPSLPALGAVARHDVLDLLAEEPALHARALHGPTRRHRL